MTEMHYLIAAIVALSGVVGYLYRRFEKRADKCEEDRAQLWAEVRRLTSGTCSRHDCKERIPLPMIPDVPPGKIIVAQA